MRHETDHQGSKSTRSQQAPPDHNLDEEHDSARARDVSNALLDREGAKGAGDKQGQKPAGPQEAELTVSAGGVVDLGTGVPRLIIKEHVDRMVDAWNAMVQNLTGAVSQFVDTVQHSQVKAASSGLMTALLGKVESLLVRAATFVTGTPLGATLGIAAIKQIVATGDALERAREQADKTTFIDQLYATEETLKQKRPNEGGQHAIISALDARFMDLGKSNPEDAYKLGDRGVVGAQAAFLKDLDRRAQEYESHVPSKAEFVAKFLQEWVAFHHKKRKRSAMRSPFEESTYQDGYIELKTTLHYDAAYSGWFVAHGSLATATLHCPNAAEVAHTLQQTVDPFNLDELDVPIVIDLHAADSAWAKMPAHWKHQRDRRVNVRNGWVTSGAKDYWQWVMETARTSTREVLAGVTKLQG